MKRLNQWLFGFATLFCVISSQPLSAQTAQPARIAIINTRRCLEESKLSKQERSSIEKMSTQMETVLKDKGKALQAIEHKLSDEDYLEAISDEAAGELKHKRNLLRREGMELEQQFLGTLEEAKMKSVQGIVELVAKASKQIAEESEHTNQPIDLILTNEAATYFKKTLDITDSVLAKMDSIFESEQKNVKP